jgi:hypothetical protein
MIIRGIGIPLGKINRAPVKWGIKNSPSEISRILKQAPGKKLHICKECFENVSDAHACDFDPRSEVGEIVKVTHNIKKNTVDFDVKVTNELISNKIATGQIKKSWSPYVSAERQDDDGWLYNNEFGGLTLVNNPAYDECTFDVVYTAEGGDNTSNEEENTTEDTKEESKKKGFEDVNGKPKEENVTISKKDFEALMARVASIEEKTKEEEKKEDPAPQKTDMSEKYLTPEQVQEIIAQDREKMNKENAINEYRAVAHSAGIKIVEEDTEAMKNLPLAQIQKLTSNIRSLSSKIPVEEKKSNKPIYYDEKTGTGGFDGSNGFTVGYKLADGTWSTELQ